MRTLKRKFVFLLIVLLSFNAFSKQKGEESVDLHEIVRTGSVLKINSAVKKNKEAANQRYGQNGDTLLMAAIQAGRKNSVITTLLDLGFSPDTENNNGDTALIYAAKYGAEYSVLKNLIKRNAKSAQQIERVMHKNNAGQSAIDFVASDKKKTKLLQKYWDKHQKELAKKQKKAERAKKKEKPQETIAESNDQQLEDDFEEIDKYWDWTNENIKIADEDEEEIEYEYEYVENPEENVEENIDETAESIPQEFAEAEEETETEEVAQAEAEQVEAPPAETPEEITFSKEAEEELIASKEAAEEALKKRRDPNKRMYLFEGFEAFEVYDDTVKTAEKISNPDAKDEYNRTLMHTAAANDDTKLIQQLIKSGADINLTDSDSWTPLMYAARFAKKRETISMLIKNGADIRAKNRFGISALQIAASFNSNAEILDELAKYSPAKTLIPSFIAAVGLGRDKSIIQVFFKYGLSPNLVYKGKTPLMYAAETNTDTNCIKFLLENGADTTYITADKKDAYYFASKNPNLPHNSVYWSLNNSGM